MQRIAIDERADWIAKAEAIGFIFHTLDGERYWDERAYYAFTLKQIEQDLEGPTNELAAMCRELVTRAIADDEIMRKLAIPQKFWNYISASWKKQEPSLYGRFDLRYNGRAPAKLLEFNADTPTSLFETGVFQWQWLEDAIERAIVPKDADQFNSVHERLIAGWQEIGAGRALNLAGVIDDPEDGGTVAYLNDTAQQAGLKTTVLPMDKIGRNPKGLFVDQKDVPIELMFKLYPWEWMMREEFGASLPGSGTQFIEPPWKAILSNKGILPLLWSMYPRHPNLLPAAFENDAEGVKALGESYVRKPLFSREGANIEIVVSGAVIDRDDGPYGQEGFIRQGLATLPRFEENYTVLGSWLVRDQACGLSVREALDPITKNTSRFLPHAIVG
ncbi:putative acid--amine ligase YjfC [Variibacter gotjawalensis]|uniref:Putative acid--amine ligase YjfC n=1 Tax=Variibacter gotjawalensis TaxID=1333996 RepID=A0A0S3PWL9_9BRAD|nr:glutathionylspermidine synthase family protein [Variibacter gotjawalensis]NIK46137.1 glutathionylspermidine synthase [Variibacter gotjawalensis]RZS48055.1 glutathionylspermidine synthase [Variibacter gotjawalensis]BAT60311.1 putative acid--amine ligase YjfC [Variibacter gotjawalensis]